VPQKLLNRLVGRALCELQTQRELEASAYFDQIIAPDVLEIIVRLQGKRRRPLID